MANRSSSDGCDASIGSSSIAVMMSPTRRPAVAAEPPSTRVTRTPVRPAEAELLGELRRQHLHRHRHPGLARLEARILDARRGRPRPPSACAAGRDRTRPGTATGSCCPLGQLLDDCACSAVDVLHGASVDLDDHVVRARAPAGLPPPGRPAGRRERARPRGSSRFSSLADHAVRFDAVMPTSGSSAIARLDAFALLRHDPQRLLRALPRSTTMSTGFPSGSRITQLVEERHLLGEPHRRRPRPPSFSRTSPGSEAGLRRRRPVDRASRRARRARTSTTSAAAARRGRSSCASTRPSLMIAIATSRARSAGIAPARPMLISLTPTISPLHVDQRAAGIAAEDRRVVADPADDRADILAVERHAVEGPEQLRHDHLGVADDAHRHRLRQRERAAERQHAIADAGALRASPKLRHRKPPRRRRLQLQHRDVGQRIGADQLRRDLLARRQRADDRLACGPPRGGSSRRALRGDDRAAARRLRFSSRPSW